MKKLVFLLLLFMPMISFGAPSVRILGNQPALSAAAMKVTPIKSAPSSSNTSVSRVGSVRTKTQSNTLGGTSTINSSSRFPVITPAHSYNNVKAPKAAIAVSSSSDTPSNTCCDDIVQNIKNNYYDKTEVYNNNEFVEAVEAVFPDPEDDPRIDAVRIGSRPYHEKALDPNYVYMWIEEVND